MDARVLCTSARSTATLLANLASAGNPSDRRPQMLFHLDPCHPDIECRTFDIKRHVRYRRVRYRMCIRYRRFAPSMSYFDIKGSRYRRSNNLISKVISKVMNRIVDIEFSCLPYRINIVRYRMLISYTILKVFLTFDIEGHVIIYRVRYPQLDPQRFDGERSESFHSSTSTC
jgi:hypothetical protein